MDIYVDFDVLDMARLLIWLLSKTAPPKAEPQKLKMIFKSVNTAKNLV